MLLAIPALLMIRSFASGEALAMDLLQPTGETALRLMLLAMLAGPLADIFGRNRFLRAWLSVRRNLGVAAFAYAVLHLVFYAIDMGALGPILDELPLPGIWTGWLSFLAMLAAASISTDAAMRALGRWWKRVQLGLYAAVLLAAAHWWLLDRAATPAIVHLAPLLLAWSARLLVRHRRATPRKELTT
jgi:sulfoxide reductase heme-binding subunit YedZ